MTSRQITVVSVGTILILGAAVSLFKVFSNIKKEDKPVHPPMVVRKVSSSLVSYSDIESPIQSAGRVLSQQSVDVISEVQGKILQGGITLKKGSNFKQGDMLVKIYNTDAMYTLQAKKSIFLNLLANILPDMKIDYPQQYKKWADYFETIKIDQDLPPIPEIESRQEKIFLSGQGILNNYYSIKSDEVKLKKYSIYAPFDGSIQEVLLEIGSVANPGSRIASIIRTNQLEIEVPVKVIEAKWVQIGQKAQLRSDRGKKIGQGKVVRKSKFVDPGNQSINIYVEILPGTEQVFAGQYFNVEFQGMTVEKAMEIPRNAVFNRNMVYVVDSGYLVKQEIEIVKLNEQTLLFRGLSEGDEVVTQPLSGVNANMAVQTDFSSGPSPENNSSESANVQ
jgi:membrane fusion protein, multidrug efflux system